LIRDPPRAMGLGDTGGTRGRSVGPPGPGPVLSQ